MRKHIAARPLTHLVELGASLPFRGEMCRIEAGQGRAVRHAPGVIQVPLGKTAVGRRIAGWLKAEARTHLAAASGHYSARVGQSYAKLALRDTRSRWGSCSTTGTLSYSWRLIMAPPQVLDYVAAHEVAHLVEMNHSPAFWRVVEDLMPDYDVPRRWLRTDGSALHHYRFDQD